MDDENDREGVDLPDLERRHRHAIPPLPRDFFPTVRDIFREIDSELESMDPRSTDYYELQKIKSQNMQFLDFIVRKRIRAILDSAFSEALKHENVDLSEASMRKNFLREENAIIRMIALIINAYYKHVMGYVKAVEETSPETFSDGLYSRIVPIILGIDEISAEEETSTLESHDVDTTIASSDGEIPVAMTDETDGESITVEEGDIVHDSTDEEEFAGLVEEEPAVNNPVRKEISRPPLVLAYSDNDITIPIGDDRGDFELMIEENSVLSLKEDTGIVDFIANGLLKDIPVGKGGEDGD